MRKGAQVARKIAREYPGIEASDIEQEIYVHMLANKKDLTAEPRTDAYWEVVMHRSGSAYAAKERYSYIHYSSEWIYTPTEIRALFQEAFFSGQMWDNMPLKDEGVTITAKNAVVSLWDLAAAFDTLSPEDRYVIDARYNQGLTLDETERKRLERAIDKVTRKVNGSQAAKTPTETVDPETI
jgi:DNA-directed RNA polymerase specialized sigma24 family protein